MEIAIGELGDLGEERDAESRLEAAPHPHHPARARDLEREERADEDDEAHHRARRAAR